MLLNIRIGPEEERIVRGLRRAKVNVSALLRKAIRDSALPKSRPTSLRKRVEQILRDLPVEVSETGSDAGIEVDLTDRHSMRAAIIKSLKSK